MASVTQVAGGSGFAPHPAGGQTTTAIVSENPMPRQPSAPGLERIGSVRILRASPGWRGVALRLADPTGEDDRFELALTAGDGRSIAIASADQEDAVALWRHFGKVSGLPLLLETVDGTVSQPFPQLGRLALGPTKIRRRYALLNGRRPRFLTRRKPGRVAQLPVMVSGERLTD